MLLAEFVRRRCRARRLRPQRLGSGFFWRRRSRRPYQSQTGHSAAASYDDPPSKQTRFFLIHHRSASARSGEPGSRARITGTAGPSSGPARLDRRPCTVGRSRQTAPLTGVTRRCRTESAMALDSSSGLPEASSRRISSRAHSALVRRYARLAPRPLTSQQSMAAGR